MKFKLALVTGASSGIGEALCHLLASKGIDLLITGRNEEALNLLAQQLSGRVKVTVLALDMLVAEDRQKLCENLYALAPDLVINNAGFAIYGDALTFTTEEQLSILEVNNKALTQITLEAARTLVSLGKQGVIVNVASIGAYMPFPKLALYAASKAYVNSVSQALDYELKPHGVRVLSTCPGVVATNFSKRAANRDEVTRNGTNRIQLMTSDYAAKQIWQQIEAQKPVHIFNLYYRMMVFLASYCIPKRWLMPTLNKQIKNRIIPRPIIKIKNS